MRKALEPLLTPILKHATRSYIAGDDIEDALQICASAASRGYGVTVCYWQETDENPDSVAARYCKSIMRIVENKLDAHLSVKIPAIQERANIVAAVVARAREKGIAVDFDAHGPEKADDVFKAVAATGAEKIGLAIPGRWRRSLADAERAAALGLRVRVVKGEFPGADDVDLREGFLNVIDRLAGHAREVGVATHDAPLAREAIKRLVAAGTPCEQELLFGLPFEPAAAEGRKAKIPLRVYVPYGSAWLPYSVSRALKNPRTIVWLARDFFSGRAREIPAPPKG